MPRESGSLPSYVDSESTAQAALQGLTNQRTLLVLDIDPDDYGRYAGDVLDDDWQVAHFDIHNIDAAPSKDVDGNN